MKKSYSKFVGGFTLNELMVTIGIIGILATIVTASLLNVKAKSRDAKRAGELKDLEQAVEGYFQTNYNFPNSLVNLSSYYDVSSPVLINSDYKYNKTTSPNSYCLGAKMEVAKNDISCDLGAGVGGGGVPGSPNIEYNYRIKGP